MFIHRFTFAGNNMVLDVNSGAVHLMDGLAFEVCGRLAPPLDASCPESIFNEINGYSKEEISRCYDELFELYQNGVLFSEDKYRALGRQKGEMPVKALCLHVSHDCNLRCAYCFAGTGSFGRSRGLMDEETARAAIDFVIKNSLSRRNIEVDFFGGEPLMAMDTVRKTVEYARSLEEEHNKVFRFTITTNGVLLDDENIDYINREMSNVVLSLDGRREINDHFRKTRTGEGSFDIILPKFQKLVAGRGDKDYYVRATFTAENTDFVDDVLALYEMGFKNLSAEPVVADKELGYSLKSEHLPEVFAAYDRLALEILERTEKEGRVPFTFFHFMIDLNQGPCVYKRLRGCGSGSEYVAVTPEGDIYPCHQFVGLTEYKMGNVHEGTFNQEMAASFADINVYTRQECGECFARFYCSGGCSAANLLQNGDISKPYAIGCELEKKRVECAVGLAVCRMISQG